MSEQLARGDGRTHLQIMDSVRDAERRFPVDTWTIGDLHVWPLVRYPLFFSQYYDVGKQRQLDQLPRPRTSARAALARLEMLAKGWYAAARDYRHNVRGTRPVDVLLLTYDVHRIDLDGVWYDRFCDPVIEALGTLGKSSVVCELLGTPDFHDIRVPRFRPSLLVQHWLDRAILRQKLRLGRARRDEHLPGFDEFLAWVRVNSGSATVPTRNQLHYVVELVFDLARHFDCLLDRCRPSLVIEVQHYHELAWGLTIAARRHGVPTMDLQHGLQGDQHAGYGSWTRVPPQGYELMPDYFWCWSEEEAASIRRWSGSLPAPAHQPFVGGDFWWAAWQRPGSELRARYEARVWRLRGDARAFVLVTSSYVSDLTDWLLEAIARAPLDIRWGIRLHPNDHRQIPAMRARLDARGLSRVELAEASTLPLPALLQHIDLNVTSVSTTVIEAARLGIPSIVTDPTSLDIFPTQVAAGLTVPAYSTAAMLNQLDQQLRLGRRPPGRPEEAIDPIARLAEFLEFQVPSVRRQAGVR